MTGLRRNPPKRAGFTLAEVMIALSLISVMCLAVFAGLNTISDVTVRTVVRSEAQRLLQAEAERLMSVSFGSFVASTADETIWSSYKTTFKPSSAAALSYPASGTTGRVQFTRRVVAVSSTTTSRTLRVEVQWQSTGKTLKLTMPVYRTQ